MGREVRMVPPGWEHPKDETGRYIPLFEGTYSKDVAAWDEANARWQAGEQEDWHVGATTKAWKPKEGSALDCDTYEEWSGPRPQPEHYMPEWAPGEATLFVMYEDTSEGTPISPAFATAEELARWLADTGASAFADCTATYEQWLSTCKRGWAISAVMDGNGMRSGVEALSEASQ